MRAVPAIWPEIIKQSHRTFTTVDAYYNGKLTLSAIPVVSGTASFDDTATSKRGVSLDVPAKLADGTRLDPGDDPAAPLNAFGQRLLVKSGLILPDGTTYLVSLGWYLITDWTRNEAEGTLSVTGQDLARLITDARLTKAVAYKATNARTVATKLLSGILPLKVSTSLATRAIKSIVFDRDRDAALDQLCAAWPARWYVDDTGTAQFAKPYAVVSATSTPVMVLTDGNAGTVTDRGRGAQRGRVYNCAVVDGKATSAGKAGPHAEAKIVAGVLRYGGPYGRVPRFLASQIIDTTAEAQEAADAMLAKYSSLAHSETVKAVPDPALQLGDVVRVYTGDGDTYLGRTTGITLPLTSGAGAMTVTVSTLPAGSAD